MKYKTYLLATSSLFLTNAYAQDVNVVTERTWFDENWLWLIAVVVLIILIAIITGTANSSKRVTTLKKTVVEGGVTVTEETKVEEE